MTTIFLPERFSTKSMAIFLAKLYESYADDHLVIDMRKLTFIFPGYIFAMAAAFKEVRKLRGEEIRLIVEGHDVFDSPLSYLKTFGFFDYIGCRSLVGDYAPGRDGRYLPIKRMERSDFDSYLSMGAYQLGIQRECDRISRIIFDANEQVAQALSYCFREIVRNSFEHGRVDECAVIAQRWNDGFAEVSILDHGCGVYNSLKNKFKDVDPERFLEFAIQPGISGSLELSDGAWSNSGFGLYVVSEVGSQLGQFEMYSAGFHLKIKNGKLEINKTNIQSTLVRLRVSTNKIRDFDALMKDIIQKGEEIAANTVGAVPKASSASKLSKILM